MFSGGRLQNIICYITFLQICNQRVKFGSHAQTGPNHLPCVNKVLLGNTYMPLFTHIHLLLQSQI